MPDVCSYATFWDRYLRAHARASTRALHYCGTSLALVALLLSFRDWRFIIGVPVIGYGFAWTAHFLVEHNRPETFGRPLWSLYSDLRMLGLFLTGRLEPHLRRVGLR